MKSADLSYMIGSYDLQIVPDCNAGGKRPHLSWQEEMAVPSVQQGSHAGAEEEALACPRFLPLRISSWRGSGSRRHVAFHQHHSIPDDADGKSRLTGTGATLVAWRRTHSPAATSPIVLVPPLFVGDKECRDLPQVCLGLE